MFILSVRRIRSISRGESFLFLYLGILFCLGVLGGGSGDLGGRLLNGREMEAKEREGGGKEEDGVLSWGCGAEMDGLMVMYMSKGRVKRG